MAGPEISRKLAVIVHADVAGSTALVQRNETLAHQRINDGFRQFSSIIHAYGGAVHEVRGDALVAEFARPSDAVSAALKFQSLNGERQTNSSDGIDPIMRIGIALGEEVIANDTVTGAGVVLAQRVEQLSEPGGLCITGAIHEAIPNRMPFERESLGEQNLKGFDEPVRVYRLALKPGSAVPEPEASKKAPPLSRRWRWVIAIASAVVVAIGASLWLQPSWLQVESDRVDQTAPSVPAKPSIAVLPFKNLSNDPEQEYFSDGMTNDIITELSKLSGLFIIASNSVFTYKGKPIKVQQIGEDLGVRFVLEGSVQRAGDSVRINVRFVDAATGGHLWAERYDGTWENIFRLQDTVAEKVVSALSSSLERGPNFVEVKQFGTTETSSIAKQTPLDRYETENPAAYDSFLKGLARLRKGTSQDAIKAVEHFQHALDLDPSYGAAHAALAQTYWQFSEDEKFNSVLDPGVGASFPPPGHMTYLNAWRHLQNARATPSTQVHTLTAHMLQRQRRFDEAMREAEKAVMLNPNNPEAYDVLIENLIYAGKTEEALELIDRSLKLDPIRPGEKLFLKGFALYMLDYLEEAVDAIEKARGHNPGQTRYAGIQAAALAELGRPRQAEVALKHYLSRASEQPDLNWAMFRWPFQEKAAVERLANSLIKAGMRIPERRYYLAATKDRLSSEEITSLLANKTMKGANRGYFGVVDRTFWGLMENEFVITRDQSASIVRQGELSYFRTNGETTVKDNLLCDHWLDFLGEYCVAIFRNAIGSRDTKDQYLFFTLMSAFSFSVFPAED